MTKEQLKQKFIDSPYLLKMGAGKLAKRFHCDKEDIYQAKEAVTNDVHQKELKELRDDLTAKYIGSEKTSDSVIKKFESSKPLTPKEIEELAGVDGITTEVARVWDKLQPSGKWTYSIDIRYKVKDFYTKEELKEKLSEIFPNIKPFKSAHLQVDKSSHKALNIVIADDHVGAVNTTNIFGNNPLSYEEKLSEILNEVKSLGTVFEKINLISLGDQLNGWNSQTTRGGHTVKSLSNKDQYDLYVKGRIKFYESLFASGLAESYAIYDVENSNHSGLGLSYMANQTLALYVEMRFPEVEVNSITEPFGSFVYGAHLVVLTHGKDEEYMKKPFPSVLDAKTDLYINNYVHNLGFSTKEDNVTLYKGDLHQYGTQVGTFGRYVNVQSLIGNTDYGDLNFNNTKAGALLEIMDRFSYRTNTIPIWFK